MNDSGMDGPGMGASGADGLGQAGARRPTRLWWWRAEEGPDAGSPTARVIALVALIVLVGTVVFLNQFGGEAPPPEREVAAGQAQALPAPAADDPFVIAMKMLVRMAHVVGTGAGSEGAALAMHVDANARGDRQQFWGAIAAAEIAGADAGLERLDKLETELAARTTPTTALAGDIEIARAIYQGRSAELDGAELDDFYVRQGWFGDLARQYGVDAKDPAKAALVGGGLRLIFGVMLVVAVVLIAVVGALVGGVAMLVAYSNGKIRRAFVPPTVGGSVWLETAAVFVASFLMLKVVASLLVMVMTPAGGTAPAWVYSSPLVLQWCVLLSVLWPLVRGVSLTEWRRQIGWHSGLGFWREVGAGVWGYFAGLPLLGIAMGITIVIVMVRGAMAASGSGEAPAPPSNPILELLTSAGPLQIALLFVLATVWAPLAEEMIFRGALFRHVRARVGVLVAAPLTAVVFGVMHGYDALLLMPVITIGFIFAFVREWRGSLIGPMVAHGLHNATILTIAITLLGGLT